MHGMAMTEDRRAGRDRRRGASAAHAMELRVALASGAIEVLFQPQFAAEAGAVLGGEALVRWAHPERGLLDGGELFAAAERVRESELLWRHVSSAAMTVAASWPAPLRLSLNVTPAELAADHFPESLAAMLLATGLSAERLTLEITEQSLVADLEGSALKLRQVADLGSKIALDDFGAGFCNFRYLKRLPLHYLKLDRSMVQGIGEDRRDLEVLRGIVAMASALGLDVIAEGIESEGQRAAVAREGCAAWQGFLGAPPLTASEFATLIA